MGDYTEDISFYYTALNGEKIKHEATLNYTYPGGMDIAAFHRACKRFGYALGFAQKSIEEYFGEDSYDDLERDIG